MNHLLILRHLFCLKYAATVAMYMPLFVTTDNHQSQDHCNPLRKGKISTLLMINPLLLFPCTTIAPKPGQPLPSVRKAESTLLDDQSAAHPLTVCISVGDECMYFCENDVTVYAEHNQRLIQKHSLSDAPGTQDSRALRNCQIKRRTPYNAFFAAVNHTMSYTK
jgi:hypothetical protein